MTTSYQYDSYNNATQVSVVNSDGFISTTANTYTNDTTNWFLGRLARTSVTRTASQPGQFCGLPWGGTVASGQSVTAYSAVNPPVGQACSTIAQTRTCTAGTLSGSATQQSCVALCALPWGGTISPGQTVTAYSAAAVPSPQVCSSVAQTRTCGAAGILSGSFANQSCVVHLPETLYLTSGSTWTVPGDWSNAANKIEVIGGGGGGLGGGGSGDGGGGGGGGYSSITNLTLTPGSTVSYNVGLGGAGAAGGNTWFNGGSLSNASVSAQGGGGGGAPAGGSGGQASNGIGTTRYFGGSGGGGGYGGGGGGGAAGPHGNGGAAGSYAGGDYSGGGGGGGADGGAPGGNDSGAASGAGGNGWQGNGGWAGNCVSGSNGTGAGGSGGYGGGDPSPGYDLLGFYGCGGVGSMDTAFDASHGSGGGGGGGGSNWFVNGSSSLNSMGYPGGAGASFGGGGGGGGARDASGSPGGNGIIVITYTPGIGS